MRGQYFTLIKQCVGIFTKTFFASAVFIFLFSITAYSAHAAFTFSQSGVDDFNDSNNTEIEVMDEFNGYMYACTTNANGVQIWRTNDPANLNGVAVSAVWSRVVNDGFGDVQNGTCSDMEVFNNELYVSTRKEVSPGELWKTSNGTSWTQVGSDGFGDVNNFGIGELTGFNGRLYANTVNLNAGSEVWRSDTNGDNFTLVATTDNGFGDASNTTPRSGLVFDGNIYFGNYNLATGGEVWRSSNGTSWSQVNADGFGDSDNSSIDAMEVFNSELYLGTTNGTTGGQLWKTAVGNNPASFSQVVGITEVDSFIIGALHVRNDLLFLGTSNFATGTKVWTTTNGSSFTRQNSSGYGDMSNYLTGEIATLNGVTILSTSTAGGDLSLYYPDLSPTISNVTASQRNDGTGYVDISFDIDTVDRADEVEALVQFDLGNGFSDAYLLEADADTTATDGDPEVLNANTNQIGNSSGYIVTSSGTNTISTVWHSKRDNANVVQNNSVIRIRGFSGTNGSFESSTAFVVNNSDLTAPSTTASPAGGVFVNGQTVTLTCSDGLGAGCNKTYFTVDGSTPTTASSVYSGPISLSQSAALKFFSVDFAGNTEQVQTELYTITSNGPALRLTKTVLSTSGARSGQTVAPGEILTYFVDYQNLGQNSATGVVLTDSIPSYTSFIQGSIVLNGSQLTDAQDGDAADFNGTNAQQITFDLGTIASGASGRFSFQVMVQSTARSGDTVLSETRGQYNPFNIAVASNTTTNVIAAQGEIGGIVFSDRNQNGVLDSFENGLANVTVRIFDDINRNGVIDAGDTGAFIGNTNSAGAFLTTGMSAGFYLIQVDASTLGSLYSLTTNNNPGQVVLRDSLQKFTSAHFGYNRRASVIGGVVRNILGGPSAQPNVNTNASNVNANTNANIGLNLNASVPATSNQNVNQFVPNVNVNSQKSAIDENTSDQAGNNALVGFWENAQLQDVVQYVIAPIIALASLVNLLSAVSVANTLWPFLKYLSHAFTEPLRFFGYRRSKKWGSVFNSLTKEPIDLAIVRLFEKDSNKLVESFVTDVKGRYYFLAEPDKEYYLSVKRDGFIFPAKLPVDISQKSNVYKGGAFSFAEGEERETDGIDSGGVVTFEVPLDPEQGVTYVDDSFRRPIKTAIANYEKYTSMTDNERERENRKVMRAQRLQKISTFLSYIGPLLGLIVFTLSPSWWTGVLLIVHIVLFLFFMRLGAKYSAYPWGKVYDKKNGSALSKSIVRLFEPKFGRLLHTRVTTSNGRYGFLVGDKQYVVVPERDGYHFEDKKLTISPRGGIVKEDIGLEKKK